MSESPERYFWPDVPRICFGAGEPAHLNANVGWVRSQRGDTALGTYAAGYRDAACVLFESLDRVGGIWTDVALFPIAFLWRHHIELLLKDIISRGRRLNGDKAVFPTHHNLDNLWKAAKPYVMQCGPEDAVEDAPEVSNVEANIHECARIDPESFTFRYSTKRDGSESLPNGLDCVNLRALHEGMCAVATFLSGVSGVLADRQQYVWNQEAKAEADAEAERQE